MALFATSRTVLWLLLVPLAFSLITIATSMRTSLRRRGLQLTDHRLRVERWLPDSVPAVDVFLPSAGESMAILHNTFRHVAALSWPGTITVYVLDDSARPEVRHAAAGYGFTYLSRPDPGYLKKGAMYLLAGANAYIVLPAVMAAVRPAITPTLAALRRRAILPKRRLHFRLPRREKLDPAADWIARVVRITALPPEFQARVAA